MTFGFSKSIATRCYSLCVGVFELNRVAPLVADPSPDYSTTDTDTHPLVYGDYMVHIIGCIINIRSFITRQSPAILDAPLYIEVTFERIFFFNLFVILADRQTDIATTRPTRPRGPSW